MIRTQHIIVNWISTGKAQLAFVITVWGAWKSTMIRLDLQLVQLWHFRPEGSCPCPEASKRAAKTARTSNPTLPHRD